MANTVKMGIIGLGVASNQILPAMRKHPNVEVTAAAEVREQALEVFQGEYGGETFTSVEALCESPNVDAVYICTPNHLHREHVVTAAEHKKHIIVEKPMGITLDECEEMNAAAERNGVRLLCGHTHSFDPPIRKMRELIQGGEIGRLRQVVTFNYNEFMYRPRMAHELDPTLGGNVIYNQGPHQIDIVRLLGGGMVRSVRAMTGNWDPDRLTDGAWAAYLEFEDGTPALLGYNGYAHFDSAELHYWIGEGGQPRAPDTNARVRQGLVNVAHEDEGAMKEGMRYGAERAGQWLSRERAPDRHQPFFGFVLASCEQADLRQSPDGVYVYGNSGVEEIELAEGLPGREAEIDELVQAISDDRPVAHDGRWGTATLEVVLGIMESARERKEIYMSRQVPSPE